MLYVTTPSAAAFAVHVRLTFPHELVAASPVGADGAVTSSPAFGVAETSVGSGPSFPVSSNCVTT